MKKFAIALILLAAAPAVATASSSFMSEMSGGSEVVSSSFPADAVYESSKSSRPVVQRHWASTVDQPMTGKISPDWL